MIHLRDYQEDLLDEVQVALSSEKARVMMQLPTGGGKTVIAGALLNHWLTHGRKAVWLTHRRELVLQTRELLASANVEAMVDTHWISGDDAPARRNRVVILMAQTVSRRTSGNIVWTKYNNDDLMIIDEAHHAAADGWTRAMQQWPGRILGMTATPWRLSQKEGFDHLFNALVCGPSVVDLQSGQHLCSAHVLRPSSQWIVRGGAIGMDGDFTETGIEVANQSHILTAGALRFWQEHAQGRQTIVYAVSVDHAHNLAAVFNDAGVPAALMLGETRDEERTRHITAFTRGNLRVLVNVSVATEGFDLPDASCVVITRPTKSLTLYLQMVGRGLRPKESNGNCLILDLAANAEFLGLPEDDREWSLEPRAVQEDIGDAVTVWCDRCKSVSPAASHACLNCGAPFGKVCSRCGTWRAWRRWSLENQCGDAHELVCDLCHRDAHIEAQLPIDEQLAAALTELEDKEIEMSSLNQMEQAGPLNTQSFEQYRDFPDFLDQELSPGWTEHVETTIDGVEVEEDFREIDLLHLETIYGPGLVELYGQWRLYWLLRQVLEEEQKKIVGADQQRQHDLRKTIEEREANLADDAQLDILFGAYISNLPANQAPKNKPQEHRMFTEWEDGLQDELQSWKGDLAQLENQPTNKSLILNGASDRITDLLRQAAKDINLLPDADDEATKMASQRSPRRKRSGKASLRAHSRPYGARKNTATHPEQLKELALRLYDAGNNARQVAEELFDNDFGTREGRMIGTQQMAKMLKRWTAEPKHGKPTGSSKAKGKSKQLTPKQQDAKRFLELFRSGDFDTQADIIRFMSEEEKRTNSKGRPWDEIHGAAWQMQEICINQGWAEEDELRDKRVA